MSLPSQCLLCDASLSGAAKLQSEQGDSLSCTCPHCGTLIYPPEVLALLPGLPAGVRQKVALGMAHYHQGHPGAFVRLKAEYFA